MPRSKAVYFFRSQVSVDACPPAIHRSTRQSAVGSSFLGWSSARRPGPNKAAAPAAPPARRKSRRVSAAAEADQSLFIGTSGLVVSSRYDKLGRTECPHEKFAWEAIFRIANAQFLRCHHYWGRPQRLGHRLLLGPRGMEGAGFGAPLSCRRRLRDRGSVSRLQGFDGGLCE